MLTQDLIRGSENRLPENLDKLIEQAKTNPSILKNPANYLRKRAVLLTEAKVPAPTVHERILGSNDYQDMNYFQRGLNAGEAVCRLTIRYENGVSYGTGFLISERLIMTNNHVLENELAAATAVAEFDYELDSSNNYRKVTRAPLDPAGFFYTNQELDFTIVALSEPQHDRCKIRLIQRSGKAVYNEELSIIQHPDGREKKIAVRNNRYLSSTENTIWYTTDTSPGSSGSPVFNDDWQLVALHHSGVPETTISGQYVLLDGTLVDNLDNIQESKIKWKANEGIRISSIVADLNSRHGERRFDHLPLQGELLGLLEHARLENVAEPEDMNMALRKSEVNQQLLAHATYNNTFSAPLTGGIQVIVNILPDQLTRAGLVAPLPEPEAAKRKIKIVLDPDYNNRIGYEPSFLVNPLDLQQVVSKVNAKKNIALSQELKYHHFSIYQADEHWNMAYITAVNIDGGLFQDFNRPDDKWFSDPRLTPPFSQLEEDVYYKNNLDKGHLVRREDPSWGTSAQALKATFDTYHFTNACPQHAKLNQGKMEWQGLENYVLDMAIEKKLRVSVFTGPILIDDPAEYEEYRGIRVPMQFYKLVVLNRQDFSGIYAAGYVLSQYQYRDDFEKAMYNPVVHQRSIQDIIDLTALDFSPLLSSDTFEKTLEQRSPENVPLVSEQETSGRQVRAFKINTLEDIALTLRQLR